MALPHGVICQGICEIWDNDEEYYTHEFHKTIIVDGKLQGIQFDKALIDGNICNVETVKPYLRPMSNMTEEEMTEYKKLSVLQPTNNGYDWHEVATIDALDWLLANHLDFMGLIDEGLAIDCTNLNVYLEQDRLWADSPRQKEALTLAISALTYKDRSDAYNDLANEIDACSKRFPEVSFAKLSRIAKRFYDFGHNAFVTKACEWINDELNKEEELHYIHVHGFDSERRKEFLERFKQAMEQSERYETT